MANFSPADFNVEDINYGQKYEDGNVVNATAINAPIEAVLLMKTLFTNTPEVVENGGTTPSVTIESFAGGYRLKFSNIKGEQGAQGERGQQGQQGDAGSDYTLTAEDKSQIANIVLTELQKAEDSVF